MKWSGEGTGFLAILMYIVGCLLLGLVVAGGILGAML